MSTESDNRWHWCQHPARFETRAREPTRRRGQVHEIRPGHEALVFRYRSGETNRDDVPVGWLGTIWWWRLRTEIHGRFSPPQLPTTHVQPTTILDAGQAISGGPGSAAKQDRMPTSVHPSTTRLFLQFSIFSVEISSISIFIIFLNTIPPSCSFFSIVNLNPRMDEKFPNADFLTQNYLTVFFFFETFLIFDFWFSPRREEIIRIPIKYILRSVSPNFVSKLKEIRDTAQKRRRQTRPINFSPAKFTDDYFSARSIPLPLRLRGRGLRGTKVCDGHDGYKPERGSSPSREQVGWPPPPVFDKQS